MENYKRTRLTFMDYVLGAFVFLLYIGIVYACVKIF